MPHPVPSASSIPPGFDSDGGERLTYLLEQISDGLITYDREWRCTYLNVAGERLLQSGLQEPRYLLGKVLWEAIPALRGTLLEAEYLRAVREQTLVEFEYLHEPWGRWYRIKAQPRRDGALSVLFQDITSERTLNRPSPPDKYEALFSSITEGFCVVEVVWDAHGKAVDCKFLEANPAFTHQCGLEDVVGSSMAGLIPGHEPFWYSAFGDVARTGKPGRFENWSGPLGRYFSVYSFPMGRGASAPVGILFTDTTAKRKAEGEMAQLVADRRARLSEIEALMSVIPVGIGIALDPECRSIRLNRTFAEVLGLPEDQNASKSAPPGEAPTSFRCVYDDGAEIPPDELPMQIAARERREVRNCEMTVEQSDGRIQRLLGYASPLLDERGQSRGSVGAFIDITERRAAEARQSLLLQIDDVVRPLQESKQVLSAILSLLGKHMRLDGCTYAEVQADGTLVVSPGAYRRMESADLLPSVVGQEAMQQLKGGQPWLVHDVEAELTDPNLLLDLAEKQIRATACIPLLRDNLLAAVLVLYHSVPRPWTQDEVALVLTVGNRCWESLERSRIARELAASEARFREMADKMPQVVWVARPDGYLEYYNRQWHDFTGQPRGEGGDPSWTPILHPEDLQPCLDRWYHSVRTGEPYEIRYRWYDYQNGNYRWFLGRALPVHDESGAILRWYGTGTDIDDLVRAEEAAQTARAEAEAANRAKDEFISALSHELRTPLTPVLMSAAAMQDDDRLPDDVRQQLTMMLRNIELEARLIDDLLDITRIKQGRLRLRKQDCEAHSLLGLAVEIVRDDALAKGVSLSLNLDAQSTQLRADPARIQQAFWNILKNAVKFTPPGGTITIESQDSSTGMVLEVKDTGVGIPSDSLERIFLPFEQAAPVYDHRTGGLGLGLSISKAIVEAHGGRVRAESDGEDRGATIRLELPGGIRPVAVSAPSRPSEDTPLGPSLRLLLVEDHPPTLAVLQRLLRKAGHVVTPASTVASALEAAGSRTFDGVVSDIGLPDGTGVELMRKLSSQFGLTGIALSGYGMEDDIARSLDAGFVAHLTKPVEFTLLRRALSVFVRDPAKA